MFAEMSCKCGSTIQLDGINDTLTEFTVIRFLEAHVACGFVTPIKKDEPERTTRREIDIRNIVFKDEDED